MDVSGKFFHHHFHHHRRRRRPRHDTLPLPCTCMAAGLLEATAIAVTAPLRLTEVVEQAAVRPLFMGPIEDRSR